MDPTENLMLEQQSALFASLSVYYGTLQVIIVALSIFLYFIAGKYISRFAFLSRKRWHVISKGAVFLVFAFSFLPYFFGLASYSEESIALASIIVTLFINLVLNLHTPLEDRLKVHVAIPSLRPFNMAIRSGLFQKLSDGTQKYVLNDDRSSIRNNEENHAKLNDLTYNALRDRADFLIVHPATETAANDRVFTNWLAKLIGNGCYVFCIENFPDESSNLYSTGKKRGEGRLLRVQSDSQSGAAVLASYVKDEHAASFKDESAFVILMSGPLESRNAKIRRDVLHDAFSKIPCFVETPSRWWGFSSGRQSMNKLIRDIKVFDDSSKEIIVLAANDDMALGACSAVTSHDGPLPKITIYGYDGILPARYAIGQNTTPFAATVHIEPEDYGKRIGEVLLSIADGDLDIDDIFIPVGQSKIKDEAGCGDELGLA